MGAPRWPSLTSISMRTTNSVFWKAPDDFAPADDLPPNRPIFVPYAPGGPNTPEGLSPEGPQALECFTAPEGLTAPNSLTALESLRPRRHARRHWPRRASRPGRTSSRHWPRSASRPGRASGPGGPHGRGGPDGPGGPHGTKERKSAGVWDESEGKRSET